MTCWRGPKGWSSSLKQLRNHNNSSFILTLRTWAPHVLTEKREGERRGRLGKEREGREGKKRERRKQNRTGCPGLFAWNSCLTLLVGMLLPTTTFLSGCCLMCCLSALSASSAPSGSPELCVSWGHLPAPLRRSGQQRKGV